MHFKTTNNTNFMQHLLDNGHAFRKINVVMDILNFSRRGHIWTVQKDFYIYRETVRGNKLNDKHTILQNKIFKTKERR